MPSPAVTAPLAAVVPSPFEVAPTAAQAPFSFAPFAPFAPVAPASLETAPAREALDTKADSVEVDLGEQTSREASVEPAVRGPYASALSASELLARAAAMGPARPSWESMVLPDDPILDEKRTPHVTERRARLTRVVKITLGACLGVCVLALGVSAISGDSSPPAAADATTVGKTVASKGIVPIEPLDGTRHGKAVRRVAPAVTTAAIVRPSSPKRR